ncbi:MAG: hypothetical protein KDA78_04215 [Planctomycetaceae bacterium]|nr:hypothetical protein [Planctomycetaceae bacterium]
MLQLGVIGTGGPNFARLYEPALRELSARVCVVTVYDSVEYWARKVAGSLQIPVAHSYRQIIERSDIDAVLMLSTGWSGIMPLVECLRNDRPVFWAGDRSVAAEFREPLERELNASTALPVIEHAEMYSPASLRLQEMQASRPDPVESLSFRFAENGNLEKNRVARVRCYEWLQHMLPGYQLEPLLQPNQPPAFLARNPRQVSSGNSVPIRINIQPQQNPADPLLEVVTIQMEYQLAGTSELRWKERTSAAENWQTEDLSRDRTAVSRQLDFFCRRLVGGLIPVHELRARLLAESRADETGDA